MNTAPDSLARLEQLVAPEMPRQIRLARRDLTPDLAQAQNLLCQRRNPIALRLAGQAVQAVLAGPAPLPRNAAWLGLWIDGQPARIGIGWGAARQLTGIPLESADPDDAAMLIEEALTEWLDEIEAQTGIALRLSAPAPEMPMLRLGLRVEVIRRPPASPLRLHLPLELSPLAAEAIAPVLGRWSSARAPDLPLALRVAVEVDTMRLTLAEIASLRPGDALVLPTEPQGARILVESQLHAPARPAGDGPLPSSWALTGPFLPRLSDARPHSTEPETPMSDTEIPQQDPETPPQTLDALELRLSFRLGDSLMSLADLRRAGPGTIVTLDRADGALVDIIANGQLIGTGEVIAVAGQRAVEIRSLFGGV